MGIVNYLLRGLLATSFVTIAGISYLLGVQRSNIELERNVNEPSYRFLREEKLRRDLVASLQAGSMQESRRLAKELALLNPVSEVPYEAAIVSAFAREDEASVAIFVTHAIARQPRSLVARLQKFRAAAKRLDYAALIHNYERLSDLRSLNVVLLSEALVGVFRAANDWSMLFKYLETRPPNGLLLIDQVLREPQLPAALEEVMKNYPSQQEKYLRRLVSDYGYHEAYRVWQSYATFFSEADRAMLPFNGIFRLRSESAPFNWFILPERAELRTNGGLFVSFSGRGTPLVARQVMSSPPGEYKLRTIASGRMHENGGALQWSVFCVQTNSILAESAISHDVEFENKVFETNLTVPDAECDFQTIELRGRAGRFPMNSHIEIESVSLISTS